MISFRPLLRAPGLTIVIVLSVALGIGVNTAIFSFLGGTVFRPLPGVTADVLTIQILSRQRFSGASWLEYRDVRERLGALAEITAQSARSLYTDNGARTERVWGQFVSDNFFSAFGVRLALGRAFQGDEAIVPGGAPVAVISHGYWQSHYAGSPDVLGQTLRLNNITFTIIGVAPAKFQGGIMALSFDVWVPVTMMARLTSDAGQFSSRDFRALQLDAVVRPGAKRVDVEHELELTRRSLLADFPDAYKEITYDLRSMWRGTRSGEMLMPVYAILQTFAALILGVVCINTANLLLARATVRRCEIGVKLAVGASPARIIRQLLAESVLLAIIGTVLGLFAAAWGIDSIHYLKMPTSVPIKIEPVFDATAFEFALGLGLICGVLFGLAPALQLARIDVLPALRSGAGALEGRHRFRDFLVGAEIAVALVILILAGLFYRSFHNAQNTPSGYDNRRVLLASVDLVARGYNPESRADFVRNAYNRLVELPGVEAAAIAYTPPLEMHGMPKAPIAVDGVKLASDAEARVIWTTTTPGYFSTMGIPLLEGGDVVPLDRRERALDAVINETAAKTYWPGISPLGRQFTIMEKTYEIVGVARDTKYETLGEAPHPAVWLTLRGGAMSVPNFYVRTRTGDPLALLPALRTTIREVDPDLALYDGRTLAQHIDNNLAIQRVCANFLSSLAPLALLLAAIGLYAVLAYAVGQRTREIGVRLTLGATPRGVVIHILREGLRVVAFGATAGWVVAFVCGWYLRKKLVGLPLVDPLIYGGIPLALLAVALFACWLPARKAAEVDPMAALRAE
jgi:predicted permease